MANAEVARSEVVAGPALVLARESSGERDRPRQGKAAVAGSDGGSLPRGRSPALLALPPRDAEIRAHAVATGSGRSHAIATAVANGQIVSWMRRKSVSNKRRRCFPTSSQRLLGCSVRLTDAPRGMRACGRRGAPEPALAASCGASGGGISNAVAFHSGGLSPRRSHSQFGRSEQRLQNFRLGLRGPPRELPSSSDAEGRPAFGQSRSGNDRR